jgi:hypothetical protein
MIRAKTPAAGVGPVSGERAGDRPPADRTRLIAGGAGGLVAVLGFTAVRAAVAALGLSTDWTLLAMPAFGLLGAVSFVCLFSAFLPSAGRPDGPETP